MIAYARKERMESMATLKEIAEIAGVNVSTVSKALRDSSDINEETKLKISKIAGELQYKHRSTKRKMPDGFRTIGVICPEIASDYYAQIIRKIEDEIKGEGHFCVIGFTDFNAEKEQYYLKNLIHTGVRGIIFISENHELDSILLEYKKNTSIPLVLIAQNTETKEFDCIKIDDRYGVKLAVEHLIRAGHKDIGYIGDELSNSRLQTFVEAMQENNMKLNRKWMQTSGERFEKCGYELMSSILKAGDIPTAILGAYDDIAIGAIKAIHDNGMVVPDDISVIGIDNIRVAPYYSPEITTVAGPVEEMGKIAANLLIKKIKDDGYRVVQNVMLLPTLIRRKSTAVKMQ
jgi:DNA-binding LacI/PurR family transcriptional regulator